MVRLFEDKETGMPCITLSGPWLQDFGFEPGQKIVADITKGQIVIKLADAVDHLKHSPGLNYPRFPIVPHQTGQFRWHC
jgi:hypothetical protein